VLFRTPCAGQCLPTVHIQTDNTINATVLPIDPFH
jgi:hypothetical protein